MAPSTRTRTRPAATSYTARLRQRTAAPKRRRPWPTWLATPYLPAALALAAEAGHLTAALIVWPAWPPGGITHILAAAGLGLTAVTLYFGPTRLTLGAAVPLAVLLALTWPASALVGLPLYQHVPMALPAALTITELSLAVLLAVHWQMIAVPTTPHRGHTRR